MLNGASIPVPSAVGGGDGLYGSENGQSLTLSPVVSFSHHHDVLGKRLILDSTDRENHFLSRFENATVHNVGRNEGNLGTVRAINNSKPLRVNFLYDSHHFCRFSRRNPEKPGPFSEENAVTIAPVWTQSIVPSSVLTSGIYSMTPRGFRPFLAFCGR